MPKKILIVDDEKEMIQALTDLLAGRGYDIISAMDGLHATKQVISSRPDIVLLDIMMPAGGGMHTLRMIRQNIKARSTPVIIITAKTDEDTRRSVEVLGVSAYFTKPIDMAKLLETINSILQYNSAG